MNSTFPFSSSPSYYTNNDYFIDNTYYNNLENKNNSEERNNFKLNNSNLNKEKNTENSSSVSNDFINIFGLRLYFDDILLICLIFFLFNQGVDDIFLFISLILLLVER